MRNWEQHWFGPVAAVRPYLFQKCFTLLVAVDILVLMIERGARYGVDRFNVPHFPWLNHLHFAIWPSGVPTANYYVGILTITSFFAFCLFINGHRPWLMALLTCLYTYCWAMSRLDSYLHHYMISLIMGCMVFFPFVDPRLLRTTLRGGGMQPQLDEHETQEARQPAASHISHRTPSTTNGPWRQLALYLLILALGYRILLSQSIGLTPPQRWAAMLSCCLLVATLIAFWQRHLPKSVQVGPSLDAWAFRVLGTTVGVIYVFTSIAKMDSEWCGGFTLRKVGITAEVLRPAESFAAALGISPDVFWAGLATFVIPLELTLACTYLVAIRQDEPGRKWLRRWCLFGWVLAIGLHLNNEMMNLIIQWFGYYMLFLATLFLLPAKTLLVVGTLFYLPDAWWRDWYESKVSTLTNSQATILLGLVSFAALLLLMAMGFTILIVGSIVAACLLAAGLVVLLMIGMVRSWERRSLIISGTTACAAALMIVAVLQCSMRFDYYYIRGKTALRMFRYDDAAAALEQATAFRPPTATVEADLHLDLGVAYRQLNKTKEAERHYRAALAANPQGFLAYYGLGNLLSPHPQRHQEAIACYQKAIEIKSDFSDAWVNLGDVLDYNARVEEAISCYQAALEVEPEAADIQARLSRARDKLKENSPSE